MTNEHTLQLTFVNPEFREAPLEPLYGVVCRTGHAADKLAAILCDLGFEAEVLNEGDGEYLAIFLVVPVQPFSITARFDFDSHVSPNWMISLGALYDTEKEDSVIEAIRAEFALFEDQICDFLSSLPQTKVLRKEGGVAASRQAGYFRTVLEVESAYFQIPSFSTESGRVEESPFLATELARFTTNVGKEVLLERDDEGFSATISIEDEAGYCTVYCKISGARDHWNVSLTPYFGDEDDQYPKALYDARAVYNGLRGWLAKHPATKNLTLDSTDPDCFPDEPVLGS